MALATQLRKRHHEVQLAHSLGEARAVMAIIAPIDVAIVDLVLGDGSGLELIDELHRRRPAVQLLLHTAMPDTRTVSDAVNLGARTVVDKPATGDELLEALVRRPSTALPDIKRRWHDTLRKAQDRLIARAFEAHGGNRSRMARRLGISLPTLRRHLARLGLSSRGRPKRPK
ncbi:MAG: response regulator [Deltaproteobacteria bacterium]|nr:response regulator [Deltaproteobacteria bacterium]